MSPPFSPDDEEDGNRRSPPGGSRNLPSEPPASTFRDPSVSSSSPYEENILTNPELWNRRSSKKSAGQRTANGSPRTSRSNDKNADETKEAEQDEYAKLKRTAPLERQPKLNKVMVEIPLVLTRPSTTTTNDSNDDNDTTTTTSLLPRLQLSQNTRFSWHSHVPPSTPDGRWTGSVSGHSKVNQLVGSTHGSAQVSYRMNAKTHLMGGLDLCSTALNNNNSQRPCQLQVGARYAESSTSSLHVSLQQQAHNQWAVNLSTRDVMDPWILSSSFGWNPRTGQWRSTLSVFSMTTHRVRLSLGMKSPNTGTAMSRDASSSTWWLPFSMAQIHLDPQLSSTRRAPVALQYQPGTGVWSLNAALHTTKPSSDTTKTTTTAQKSSSWQVGLLGGSTKASKWSILLAWTYGDVTLRIPILLSTTLAMSQKTSKEEHKVVAMATPLLVLAVSGLAQELVARVLWGNSTITSKESSDSSRSSIHPNTNNAKAKEDAQSQQTLMKRQADHRRSSEQDKNGLVIQRATYQLDDGVAVSSWDVTIPLQFWVSTDASTLTLAEGSKQHLLGFYPLSSAKKNAAAGSDDHTKPSSNSNSSTTDIRLPQSTKGNNPGVPWWKEYWTPTTKRSTKATANKNKTGNQSASMMPTLNVQYTYRGKPFEVTIRDEESLRLPQQEESIHQREESKH